MKTGLGHVFATLLVVQCGPAQPRAVHASAGLKSDAPSSSSASVSVTADSAPPVPEVVPGSPVPSGPADADPSLVVHNAYQKRQYVFLDTRLLGSVAPGAEGSFEIPPGAHNITFCDSRDGRRNAKSVAEVFDRGYAYHYDVLAR